tara:strand:- start:66 stop:362 length:297 start_codon:yes stop_codon:yes gene_type:complete
MNRASFIRIISIFFLLLFNGCVQNSAFLGPAITVASTGNIYQAGLSYGSNEMITKMTGKTTIENIHEILKPKKNENKIISSIKIKTKKLSKIQDFTNQ